ncbi:MAG: alanine/ornithine racemase family PLP-dependent enzyme [Acetobacteraceae bacterium]|nr:alanine/ornithine racemase family PLP-dependent enzyme [Acetobacteraceae bacterium]
MPRPRLRVDLKKLEYNARELTGRCRRLGIAVVGVTKACCGHPWVAQAMLRGGVAGLGDSRLENLQRMRRAGVRGPFTLLRFPSPRGAAAAVSLAEVSLNSEPQTLLALSKAALSARRVHGVVLMVEMGDLREGLWPSELSAVARFSARLPGIRLLGVGTNLACLGGALPTPEKLERLVSLARGLRRELGLPLPVVSGGNSSSLLLLEQGAMPRGITQLRLGEAILLGRETACGRVLPGLWADAFELEGEVIEVKAGPPESPGSPGGPGRGRRALLALGRQDADPEGLVPLEAGIEVVGMSSDHLVLDVTRLRRPLGVGGRVGFALRYGALLAAMTSPYVAKVFRGR